MSQTPELRMIESNDVRINRIWGRTLLLIVMSIAGAISTAYVLIDREQQLTQRAAMEQGYTQQTVPGNVGVYWVKNGKTLDTGN